MNDGAHIRFFDRHGGQSTAPFASLNVGVNVSDDPALVQANRNVVAAAMRVLPTQLVFANQVHGNEVAVVGDAIPQDTLSVDAMVTTRPHVALAIYTADCVPIALTARAGVAMAHAGWRGVASNVAVRAAEVLAREARCTAAEISAHIGPAIGPCCFSIGADVAATLAAALPRFSAYSEQYANKDSSSRIQVDLAGLVQTSLLAAGLREANVAIVRTCTMCNSNYFSHRRDGPMTGRQANVVVRADA